MKPVTQTKFDGVEGNCLMSCVASILEKPLDSLPYYNPSANDWYGEFSAVMAEMGYHTDYFEGADNAPPGYSIISGMAARGLGHACVALDGDLVHDPHPDRTGLTKIWDYIKLIPSDPPATRSTK